MNSCSARHPATVVHVPHAATYIPERVRPGLCLNDDELRRELLVMTDWYTDELFSLPGDLATAAIFPVSRLVVDPERFSDDERESMASKGMGVVYTRTSGGAALRNELSANERQSLLDAYYVPHQRAVAATVAAALAANGTCLLVDAHSFSSKPLPHEPDQMPNRCQVCIGTDQYHTPAQLVACLKSAFEQRGFAVGVNQPFSGTFVPTDFYHRNRNVISIMIEVNRSLYMDEATGERLPGFGQVQTELRQVLVELVMAFRTSLDFVGADGEDGVD